MSLSTFYLALRELDTPATHRIYIEILDGLAGAPNAAKATFCIYYGSKYSNFATIEELGVFSHIAGLYAKTLLKPITIDKTNDFIHFEFDVKRFVYMYNKFNERN